MKSPREVAHELMGGRPELYGNLCRDGHCPRCDRYTAAITARDAGWREPDLSGPMTPAELWRDYQVVLGEFCTRFNVTGSPSLREAVEYVIRGHVARDAEHQETLPATLEVARWLRLAGEELLGQCGNNAARELIEAAEDIESGDWRADLARLEASALAKPTEGAH